MDSKEAMKKAVKQTGVKEVAASMNMSASTLYNQMNDEDKTDILQRFTDFATLCSNDIAIQWACEQLGGTFVPNIKTQPDKELCARDCISRSLQEFADVMKAIGSAIADDSISKAEAADIRKEWEEVKSLLEGFVFACELGYHQKNEEIDK